MTIENTDWFYLLCAFVGLIMLLVGIYEWVWFYKLARGGFLPDQIGWRNTRWLYIINGSGFIAFGIGQFLKNIFDSNSLLFFVVGFGIAIPLTVFLFQKEEKRRADLLLKTKKTRHNLVFS